VHFQGILNIIIRAFPGYIEHEYVCVSRFTPSLRPGGTEAILSVFKALCIMGGDEDEATKAEESVKMWHVLKEVCVCLRVCVCLCEYLCV